MNDIQLGTVESKFADIIWSNEPMASAKLVELSMEQLQWKKSTTFTVLRRLCDKGLFQNVNGTVTSLISKSEFYAMQSEQFVENTFEGSLPAFLAAFTTRKNLKPEEVAEIRRMISEYGEE